MAGALGKPLSRHCSRALVLEKYLGAAAFWPAVSCWTARQLQLAAGTLEGQLVALIAFVHLSLSP